MHVASHSSDYVSCDNVQTTATKWLDTEIQIYRYSWLQLVTAVLLRKTVQRTSYHLNVIVVYTFQTISAGTSRVKDEGTLLVSDDPGAQFLEQLVVGCRDGTAGGRLPGWNSWW